MARSSSAIRQSELAGVAKALRSAGCDSFRVEIDRPDGSRMSIVVGGGAEMVNSADEIDAMIARAK